MIMKTIINLSIDVQTWEQTKQAIPTGQISAFVEDKFRKEIKKRGA